MKRRRNRLKDGSNNREPMAPQDNKLNNDGLLERARTQWQFGDWESLRRANPETLQHAPDRGQLALLAAAGHLQLGDQLLARQNLLLAQNEGCSPKLIEQILLSGVHNTLGRAAAISGQHARALEHFKQAINVAPLSGDARLFSLARTEEQYAQVGIDITKTQLAGILSVAGTSPTSLSSGRAIPTQHQSDRMAVERLAAFNLGEGWASNTVNTVIFRHHGVLTWGEFQYTAFYFNETKLRVVQRNLASNLIKTHDIAGQYNLRDAHNSISLGVDRNGYIHISYDHHATKLRYRRSEQPHAIGSWTDELSMTGVNEDRVTYPTFVLPRAGHPLTLLYRDGGHNKGSARLKTYSESTLSWTDHPSPILSGAEQKPWTSNAYWNHPAIGSDGSLHLSFVWRTDTIGEQKLVNNLNIGYAWSPDNGLNWFTSLGHPCKLPITQVNAETVWAVSPGSNLINQTSMALDRHNRAHIVFYSNDTNGVPQYQHIWFDGKSWRRRFVSSRATSFTLQGDGTLQIPISRPEIVIDSHDNVYVIYRGDITQDCMSITQLNSHGANMEGSANSNLPSATLWKDPLGFAEPVVDRSRWERDRILTMLLQHNHQPDRDLTHQPHRAPVWLVDYRIQ